MKTKANQLRISLPAKKVTYKILPLTLALAALALNLSAKVFDSIKH